MLQPGVKCAATDEEGALTHKPLYYTYQGSVRSEYANVD